MKLKKKSGLISAVIALSCASLVSVGFASWVIAQGAEKEVTGTIHVEQVTDGSHTITATWLQGAALDSAALSGDPVVSYGSSSNAASGWLQNTDGTPESLVFYLKVSVAHIDSAATFASKVSSIVMTADAGYGTAVTAQYVGVLPALNASGNGNGTIVKGVEAANDTSWEAVYTITFVWGQHFNYQNPYNYYNGHQATDILDGTTTYADDAQTSLSELYTALNGVSFTLTITTIA